MAKTYRITSTFAGVTKSVNIKKYLLDFYALQMEISIIEARLHAAESLGISLKHMESRFVTADVLSENLLLQLDVLTNDRDEELVKDYVAKTKKELISEYNLQKSLLDNAVLHQKWNLVSEIQLIINGIKDQIKNCR